MPSLTRFLPLYPLISTNCRNRKYPDRNIIFRIIIAVGILEFCGCETSAEPASLQVATSMLRSMSTAWVSFTGYVNMESPLSGSTEERWGKQTLSFGFNLNQIGDTSQWKADSLPGLISYNRRILDKRTYSGGAYSNTFEELMILFDSARSQLTYITFEKTYDAETHGPPNGAESETHNRYHVKASNLIAAKVTSDTIIFSSSGSIMQKDVEFYYSYSELRGYNGPHLSANFLKAIGWDSTQVTPQLQIIFCNPK
jgi:hypothetical protein